MTKVDNQVFVPLNKELARTAVLNIEGGPIGWRLRKSVAKKRPITVISVKKEQVNLFFRNGNSEVSDQIVLERVNLPRQSRGVAERKFGFANHLTENLMIGKKAGERRSEFRFGGTFWERHHGRRSLGGLGDW